MWQCVMLVSLLIFLKALMTQMIAEQGNKSSMCHSLNLVTITTHKNRNMMGIINESHLKTVNYTLLVILRGKGSLTQVTTSKVQRAYQRFSHV